MDKYLKGLYYKPSKPTSFGSFAKLYKQSRKDGKNYTKKQLQDG